MQVVGLTGGIASGKSAAAEAFARRGVPVIDTDHIARELVEPGRPALTEIIARFGTECCGADGTLDRGRLRRIVFADPTARRDLEAILHPRILVAVRRRLAGIDAAYVLVVVPLLAEHPTFQALMDRILVVDVPPSLQIERLMARDGLDHAQAKAMLAAQIDRSTRLALADAVIDNTGTLAQLDTRVGELHERLGDCSLTSKRSAGPERS